MSHANQMTDRRFEIDNTEFFATCGQRIHALEGQTYNLRWHRSGGGAKSITAMIDDILIGGKRGSVVYTHDRGTRERTPTCANFVTMGPMPQPAPTESRSCFHSALHVSVSS
jgi:hypothetical protein